MIIYFLGHPDVPTAAWVEDEWTRQEEHRMEHYRKVLQG